MTESTDEADGERPALFVAFAGGTRIASGTLAAAALAARRALDRGDGAAVLVFSGETGKVVDLDLRGAEQDIVARLEPPSEGAPRRGRPSTSTSSPSPGGASAAPWWGSAGPSCPRTARA